MLESPTCGSVSGLLAGRRIVVLGSATGLGRAVALAAQSAGAEVLGLDDSKGFDGIDALYLADLRDPAALVAAVDAIDGPVDGLALVPDLLDKGPETTLARGVVAPRIVAQALAPRLAHGAAIAARAGPPHASWRETLPEIRAALALRSDDLAGFVARWGHHAEPSRAARLAGWAMLAWVMAQRWTWADRAIRVNAVTPAAPGGALPPVVQAVTAQPAQAGTDQAARAFVFFLSGLSQGLTGANLAADGGLSAQILTSQDGL